MATERDIAAVFSDSTGFSKNEALHRARVLREAKILPAGRSGGGKGSVHLDERQAAALTLGFIANDVARHVGRDLPTVADLVGGAVELDLSEKIVRRAIAQTRIGLMAAHGIAAADAMNAHLERAVERAGKGWQEFLPACTFVEAVERLLTGIGDGSAPWFMAREIGVTFGANCGPIGWIDLQPALGDKWLRVGIGGAQQLPMTFNVEQDGAIEPFDDTLTGTRVLYYPAGVDLDVFRRTLCAPYKIEKHFAVAAGLGPIGAAVANHKKTVRGFEANGPSNESATVLPAPNQRDVTVDRRNIESRNLMQEKSGRVSRRRSPTGLEGGGGDAKKRRAKAAR